MNTVDQALSDRATGLPTGNFPGVSGGLAELMSRKDFAFHELYAEYGELLDLWLEDQDKTPENTERWNSESRHLEGRLLAMPVNSIAAVLIKLDMINNGVDFYQVKGRRFTAADAIERDLKRLAWKEAGVGARIKGAA